MHARLSHIVRRLEWLPLINLPVMFPLTLRQHHAFGTATELLNNGELASSESWDALRSNHPHFVIPSNREDWLAGLAETKDGQDLALKDRAGDIVDLLHAKNITDLHSVGVGGGALEYFIKLRDPASRLTASDYNPDGVARLRDLFVECDSVRQFDIAQGDWTEVQPEPRSSAVLMYRVDPHFTDVEWKSIFDRLASSRIHRILFIPATEISFQYLIFNFLKGGTDLASGKRRAFTGYMRSAKAFQALWGDSYIHQKIKLGGLSSYWLSLRI